MGRLWRIYQSSSNKDRFERIFSIQTERVINRDNKVKFKNMLLQIERQSWRGSLAGCRVVVYQHFDETTRLGFGAHMVGRYTADGEALKEKIEKSRKKQQDVLPANAKQHTGPLMC